MIGVMVTESEISDKTSYLPADKASVSYGVNQYGVLKRIILQLQNHLVPFIFSICLCLIVFSITEDIRGRFTHVLYQLFTGLVARYQYLVRYSKEL